ncbi:uncharacterized protein [Cicer arietinum]|uniref:Uncharacterized protein LOC101499759 n=1 Tax=Cicer arietinum TaxID=3827 RepID=A0A1S2XPD7_CICAR|nr:uncharacterized protein LOC101499759 [Cicer arietinum]
MEENNKWKNLPVDILEQIIKCLPLREYLAVNAILGDNYSRISDSNDIPNQFCLPLSEPPQVLLRNEVSAWFFSLSTLTMHHPKTKLLESSQLCHGSFEEWLIVCDYTVDEGSATVFFLNPVTNARIMIPSKLYFPSSDLFVAKVVTSSKPGSDRYLACLLDNFCQIAIYRPFDKSWAIIELHKNSDFCFKDLEIVDTKLYVITDKTSHSILLIYDLKDSTNGPPEGEFLALVPKLRPVESSITDNRCNTINDTLPFLAKDEALGELYLIYMICNVEYALNFNFGSIFVKPPEATNIEVFKLDMNKDPIGWQKVRLDDRVAFVSNCKSVIISRDKLHCNQELIGRNSIYFGFNFPCSGDSQSGLRLGVFCLNDRSIKYFPVDTSKDCPMPHPIWIVPSLL